MAHYAESVNIADRLRLLSQNRGPAVFLFAAFLLGVLIGLAGSLLVFGIEFAEHLTASFGEWSTWTRATFLVSIPIALLFSWMLNRYLGPGVASGGITETIIGLNLHGGYLPTRTIFAKIAATSATLGAGGSGGREGPIALIGATIGSSLSRYSHFDHDRIRSLVAAGAGAGIAASFNAPIAGMLFAMEVILGSFAIRHLSAVVIAAVTASVTTELIVGEELLLTSPPHGMGNPLELVLYAGLACLAVAAGLLYLKVLDITSESLPKLRIPGWSVAILSGLVIGGIGIVWPDSLGTGRLFLTDLLWLDDASDLVWGSLLVIAVAKMVTSALTRSGGGSAGTFMPSLVIGGIVGAAFVAIIAPVWGVSELDPGAFAVVGMACAFTTIARAPLTAVLIVFELTGNYELVLPLMLGAALATFIGDRFHAESVYTLPIRRRGIALPRNEDIDLLDTVRVAQVMTPTDTPLRPWQSLADATEFFDVTGHHGAPVINDRDELIGILTVSDIVRHGGPSHTTTVKAAMTPEVITVTPDLPVSRALARMASLGVGRLPVTKTSDPKAVVGMFRRESVVRAYDHALSQSKGRELHRERTRIRRQPGADFFDVAVPDGSSIANQTVAEVPWPGNCVVVSIQRGTQVLVPHGATVLRAGDRVMAFGSDGANDELVSLVTSTTAGDVHRSSDESDTVDRHGG